MARRKSSLADDLVLLPWWVSAILAFLVYTVLPGLLPPAIAKGGLTGIIALALLAFAALSALRSWKTRHMLERLTSIESIRELPWKGFEDLLGEAYRRQGYKVEETLGGGADGGVDLVLRRGGEVTIVQCKRWKGKPVPVQTVRELFGVLHDRRATAAKLVATTSFTFEAIVFAKGKPIELVDADALLSLLRGVQTSGRIAREDASTQRRGYSDSLAPICPKCGSGMVERTAKRGPNAGSKFWGCPRYPGCSGTREI
jgi:restriction system protein